MRAIFTFLMGAKIVWWLLITSVQCIYSEIQNSIALAMNSY